MQGVSAGAFTKNSLLSTTINAKEQSLNPDGSLKPLANRQPRDFDLSNNYWAESPDDHIHDQLDEPLPPALSGADQWGLPRVLPRVKYELTLNSKHPDTPVCSR